MKNTIKLLKSLRIVLAVLFVVCAAAAVFDLVTSKKEKAEINSIVEFVHKQSEDKTIDPEIAFMNNFEELKNQNSNLKGWLKIDAAEIDLPVMTNGESEQYYLHRSFDGSYSQRGTLFIDDFCDPDSDFFIVHGHSMKDGTMFGQLYKLCNQNTYEQNKTFTYYANGNKYTYEIVSAFHTRIFMSNEEGFRYYEYSGFKSEKEFKEFMDNSLALSEINTNIKCEYGDRIMVLSTCSNVFEMGRLVVVAKQVSYEKINNH